MSEFTYQPSQSPQLTKKPRVLEVGFGDGYHLRAVDGLNAIRQSWALVFNNRTDAIIDAIDTFLTTRGGVTSFTWTPPQGAEISVVCKSWQRQYTGAGYSSLTATFIESFG